LTPRTPPPKTPNQTSPKKKKIQKSEALAELESRAPSGSSRSARSAVTRGPASATLLLAAGQFVRLALPRRRVSGRARAPPGPARRPLPGPWLALDPTHCWPRRGRGTLVFRKTMFTVRLSGGFVGDVPPGLHSARRSGKLNRRSSEGLSSCRQPDGPIGEELARADTRDTHRRHAHRGSARQVDEPAPAGRGGTTCRLRSGA